MKRVLVLLAVMAIAVAVNCITAVPEKQVAVTVSHGDTIWSLVAERIGDGDNLETYICKTREANPGLRPGQLQAGDQIILVLPDRSK